MRAYYEIETEIPINHQLTIQLPEHIPSGRAKIAVIYEWIETEQSSTISDFLNELPLNTTGGLSQSQILNYLKQEREQWDH